MFHKEWVVSAFSQKVTYFLYKPLKNRSKYTGVILEKSAVYTESMSGIGFEVFRKKRTNILQLHNSIQTFSQSLYTCTSQIVTHGFPLGQMEVTVGLSVANSYSRSE